jgi:hypothetical protein
VLESWCLCGVRVVWYAWGISPRCPVGCHACMLMTGTDKSLMLMGAPSTTTFLDSSFLCRLSFPLRPAYADPRDAPTRPTQLLATLAARCARCVGRLAPDMHVVHRWKPCRGTKA